ncbi:uncharacterized protein [Dermacentor albipictus]|uniref:uncharacterized protein n=1 Tax=Dermacentor albipictus TaxID=60249 RepID=UPI0038FCF145
MADDGDFSVCPEEIYPPEGIAPPYHRKAPHGDEQRDPKELLAVQPPPKQSGAPHVAQAKPLTKYAASHHYDEVHHALPDVTQARLQALASTWKHEEHGSTHKTKEPPTSAATQVSSIAHKPVHRLPSGWSTPVQQASAVPGGASEADRNSGQGARRTWLPASSSLGRRSSVYNYHADSVEVHQAPQSHLDRRRSSFGNMDAWANTDLPALQATAGLEPAAQAKNVRSRKIDHYLGRAPRPVVSTTSNVLTTCASMAQACGLAFMVLVVAALCVAVFYMLDYNPYSTSTSSIIEPPTENSYGLHPPTMHFTHATEASATPESALENKELANPQTTMPYSTEVTAGDGDMNTRSFVTAAPRAGAPMIMSFSMSTSEAVTTAPQGSTTREALTRNKTSQQRMQALKPGLVVEDLHPVGTVE